MTKQLSHVTLFFALSFILTWLFYGAIILLGLNPYSGTGMVLLICGGCSPTFVGLAMVLITYNKAEKIEYFRRCYQVKRIKASWWLFILLIFPAIFAVSILIDKLMGGVSPEMINLKFVLQNPVSFIPLLLISFMSGPFAEELGWRGYALEPLLQRFGFIKASLLLGVIWCVWHLPLYFMKETWHGQMGFRLSGFWMFLLMTLGMTVIMSFVFVKTKHSILSAVMLHLCSNFTAQLLAKTSDNVEVFRSALTFAVGVALCIYMTKVNRNAPARTNLL